MARRTIGSTLLDAKSQNLIPNGGFEAWNNGVVFNGITVNGTNLADGWINNSAGNTINVNRESTEIDSGSGKYSMKVEIVTPSGSNAKIYSTHNRTDLAGRRIIVTAKVKTTIVNGIRIELSDGTGGTYSAYHTGSGNWETLTASLTFASGMTVLHVAIGFELTTVTTGIWYMDSVMVTASNKGADYVTEDLELDKVKSGALAAIQSNTQNLLVNGGFERWDYGTSFSDTILPGNTQEFCPGWNMQPSGTITWARENGAGNFDTGLYSLKVVSSGSAWYCGQNVINPHPNLSFYFGQTITFSARIKTTLASKIRIGLGDSVTANTFSTYHSGSGNWETLTVTKTISASTTYLGVMFGFLGDSGAASTVYVDSCMLVTGSIPARFAQNVTEIDRAMHGELISPAMNYSNLLINGGFDVWQRGASFANLANNAFGPDQWYMTKDGADTTGVIQLATVGNYDVGPYSVRVDITHSTSNYVRLSQRLETIESFRGRKVNLSVRIATTLSNIRLCLYGGTAGCWAENGSVSAIYSRPHSGGGSFETLTVSGTLTSSATQLVIWIGYVVTGEVPVNGYFIADSAMLVLGTAPVAYVPEDPAVALTRCQRYCQIIGGSVGTVEQATGMCYSTSAFETYTRLPVEMRAAPTVTVVGPTSWRAYDSALVARATGTLSASASGQTKGIYMVGTISAGTFTAGNATILSNNGVGAYILLEA